MSLSAPRCFAFVVVLLMHSPLYAQNPGANHIWTTIAAAGIPDESSAGRYKFGTSGSVYLSAGSPGAVLRYNVTGLPPIGTSNSSIVQVRLKDNGGARVVVRLQELHTWTGQLRTLMVLDSNTCLTAPSADYRVCAVAYGGDEDLWQEGRPGEWDFDFASRSYFFEVQLSRTTSGDDPSMQAIRICHKSECANRW